MNIWIWVESVCVTMAVQLSTSDREEVKQHWEVGDGRGPLSQAGGSDQQVRMRTALAENTGLVPSTHMVAPNPL